MNVLGSNKNDRDNQSKETEVNVKLQKKRLILLYL